MELLLLVKTYAPHLSAFITHYSESALAALTVVKSSVTRRNKNNKRLYHSKSGGSLPEVSSSPSIALSAGTTLHAHTTASSSSPEDRFSSPGVAIRPEERCGSLSSANSLTSSPSPSFSLIHTERERERERERDGDSLRESTDKGESLFHSSSSPLLPHFQSSISPTTTTGRRSLSSSNPNSPRQQQQQQQQQPPPSQKRKPSRNDRAVFTSSAARKIIQRVITAAVADPEGEVRAH